jgi:hypothetical protein
MCISKKSVCSRVGAAGFSTVSAAHRAEATTAVNNPTNTIVEADLRLLIFIKVSIPSNRFHERIEDR